MVDTVTYRLSLCAGFARIGEADGFEFAGVHHGNNPGEWAAEFPANGVTMSDGYTLDDVDSIMLWDIAAGTVDYAGIMAPLRSGNGATLSTRHTPTGVDHSIEGVDLFGLLGVRVAWPTPDQYPPWPDGYDTRTGRASTVAAEYIRHNIGDLALPERVIDQITVIDGEVGATVDWSARLQPLSTLVGAVCEASEILCRASMPTPGQIRYTLTTAADRTTQTVISASDIAGNITVADTRPSASWVIAGGDGQLESRRFATAGAGTGLGRVEQFYDVSTLAADSAVQLAADGALARASAETGVTVDSLAGAPWRYRTDYDLGDLVSVEVDGIRYTGRVDSVSFTVSATRAEIRPIIGRTPNNEAVSILAQVWGATTRFDLNIT